MIASVLVDYNRVLPSVARSVFRVQHHGHDCGRVRLRGPRVVDFLAGFGVCEHYRGQDERWQADFRLVVRRLARSIGHWSAYSISTDIESGVIVERLQ